MLRVQHALPDPDSRRTARFLEQLAGGVVGAGAGRELRSVGLARLERGAEGVPPHTARVVQTAAIATCETCVFGVAVVVRLETHVQSGGLRAAHGRADVEQVATRAVRLLELGQGQVGRVSFQGGHARALSTAI